METFTKGERVKFVEKGFEEKGWTDREGTITDHFCEYGEHRVGVLFDGEDVIRELSEEYFEHLEDPYEYAIERTIVGGPGRPLIVGDHWSSRAEVNMSLLNLNTDRTTYRCVRRRKAGAIEVVDTA